VTARFPADRIDDVALAIRQRLATDDVRVLVCSAACGADLLALSAAAELGRRRRIVLPFAVELFRERSVVDRPGAYPWGERYDAFVREAQASGDLVLLGFDLADAAAFEKTNERILDEALALAFGTGEKTEALAVWDAPRRTDRDYTEHFVRQAEFRRMPVTSIPIVG
jgi:hypothetical protein